MARQAVFSGQQNVEEQADLYSWARMSTTFSMLSAERACLFTLALLLLPAAVSGAFGGSVGCSWCGFSRLRSRSMRSGHSCGSSTGAMLVSRVNTAFWTGGSVPAHDRAAIYYHIQYDSYK